MADLLEIPVTIVPPYTERFAYVWFIAGALEGVELRPLQFNSYGNTSVAYTVNAMYSLEQIQGVGALRKGKYFGDKYGLKFPVGIGSSIRMTSNAHIQIILDCTDFSNPGASDQASLCGIQQYWGDPEFAPFLRLSDFSATSPDPPGLEPPCEGGGGSERPDYGMIYPRKI